MSLYFAGLPPPFLSPFVHRIQIENWAFIFCKCNKETSTRIRKHPQPLGCGCLPPVSLSLPSDKRKCSLNIQIFYCSKFDFLN